MPEQFDTAVEALKTRNFARYVEVVTPLAKDESAKDLWKVVGAKHGTELDLVELLLAWPQNDTRRAIRLLAPAIAQAPELSLAQARVLLEFTARVEQAHLHLVAEALRPHMAREPALGEQLGESLRTSALAPDEQVRVWAGSFCAGAGAMALKYALSLAVGDVGGDRLRATILIFLPMLQPDVLELVRAHEAALVERVVASVATTGRAAWFALGALGQASAKAVETLTAAATSGDPAAVDAISTLLYSAKTSCVGASSIRVDDLVEELLRVALRNSELRNVVGQVVASLVHVDALRGIVVAKLDALGQVLEVNAVTHFEEAFDAICDYEDTFASVLTAWLVREGVSFNALRSLLSKCSSSRAPVALAPAAYSAAPLERRAAAGRRLLALCYNGPVLCRFISLLAETPALQPEGLEQAAALLDQVFLEYPTATVEFLKPRTRAATRREPHAPVYRAVLANALRWERVLARLPRLAELRPSDAELQALRVMMWRRNREVLRIARERSVFASLATQVHIAQGHRFASHVSHNPPQVSQMVQRSHAMELPSSELADPVGGALRRIRTLSAAK